MADQPLDERALADAMLEDAQHRGSLAERELRTKPRRRRSIRQAKDSVEDLVARTRSQESNRMSPESGSLGRGGRQFMVSNVGNNGRIYLRPVVRPGIERSRPPPPPFPFTPSTPPGSTEPDTTLRRPASSVGHDTLFSSQVTPPKKTTPAPGRPSAELPRAPIHSPPRPTTHVRANSFSTVEDNNRPSLDHPGTFKVVIHRPSVKRPKTSHGSNLPVLEVPIPHYRLGRPQFDVGGAAFLRSSVYTRSSGRGEELHSSFLSQSGNDRLYPSPSGLHSSYISRRHSAAFPRPLFYQRNMADKAGSRISAPPTSTARASVVPIDPSLYDPFTLNPNDPTVVRYSATTKEITAATPTRLIAHITSPSFLDYELLSDFFLTFRSFVQPRDMVSFLVARLRWAVDRQDDFGRIVRVRTFVALRHWILNYFVDDFVPDYELRRHFCYLVNSLYEYLHGRSDGGGGDIKIVGELKKCWRRTCILYWDVPDSAGKDAAEDEILPGGQLGSRNSSVAGFIPPNPPSIPSQPPPVPEKAPERKAAVPPPVQSSKASQKPLPEPPKTPTHIPQHSQSSAPYSFPNTHTSQTQSSSNQRPVPLSPSSGRSTQVLSCSIPMKPIYRSEPGQDIPLFPHPVPIQIQAPAVQVSSAPGATASMPGSHKRSGSFTDALRDNREPLSLPKNGSGPDLRIPSVLVIPGCLVRGALYQPTAPYFDIKFVTGVSKSKSHLDLIAVEPYGNRGRHLRAENPAVKNILGTVRRALSTRHMSPSRSGASLDQPLATRPSGEFTSRSAPSEKSASTIKKKRSRPLAKSQVRIDILAARIQESFKEAMAQMELEHTAENAMPPSIQKASGRSLDPRDISQRLKSGVTAGSRSIVIVDDTNSDIQYLMSGGLAPPSVPNLPGDGKALAEAQTYTPRDQRNARATSASIDSVLAGQDKAPVVYVPTGFRKLSSANSPDSRQSAAPAPEIPRRKPMAPSITTDPSSVSTVKRNASFHAGDKAEDIEDDAEVSARAESDPTSGTAFKLSETNPSSTNKAKAPARGLRRMPAGDLKAVNNVHSLEQPRPKSAGSISTASRSMADSLILAPQGSQQLPAQASPVSPPESDGDAVPLKRRSISLIQTHSSQPNLRPSFEAEVARLAALPDDIDDDGGIESALLKLEGKYEKKTPAATPVNEAFGPVEDQDWKGEEDPKGRKKRHHKEHVDEVKFVHPLPPEAQTTSVYQLSPMSTAPRKSQKSHKTQPSRSIAESEDSYSSVPLLERGLSDAAHRTRKLAQVLAADPPRPSTAKPAEGGGVEKPVSKPASPPASNSSMEYVEETESLKRIPRGDTLPRSPTMHSSFLLDEDQSSADSNELVAASEAESTSHGVRSFFDDEAIDDDGPDTEIFTHPLRHPDTPPVKSPVALDAATLNPTTTFNQGLPTPGLTPTTKLPIPPSSPTRQSPPVPPPKHVKKPSEATQSTARPTAHLPFILAYDPTGLAQQLTIIEKDALDEIDWKELIELRWSQTSPPVNDWVRYLLTQEPRGVDLVIARFNLVVKWVKSEIILTSDIGERTACVTQYVRIAQECRKLRNYASMYQISIALLSTDVSRLKRTWEGVPETERRVMEELEKVVQPLRNFQGLRGEMERGAGGEEEGCVPFIGIYTRDLVYNAQKPAFITTPPFNPENPLVNFERHHTAATIVKSLLRLLEASSKYSFQVDPVLISRCLWLGALSDEEISRRSRVLE